MTSYTPHQALVALGLLQKLVEQAGWVELDHGEGGVTLNLDSGVNLDEEEYRVALKILNQFDR